MDVQEVRARLGLVDEALARFEPRDPTPRQIAGIFNALLTEARAAHTELTTAIAATAGDRMDVPARLADSLAHWLCVWTLADDLRARAAARAAADR